MYTADLLPQAYIYLLIQNWKVIYPAVTPLSIKFSRLLVRAPARLLTSGSTPWT